MNSLIMGKASRQTLLNKRIHSQRSESDRQSLDENLSYKLREFEDMNKIDSKYFENLDSSLKYQNQHFQSNSQNCNAQEMVLKYKRTTSEIVFRSSTLQQKRSSKAYRQTALEYKQKSKASKKSQKTLIQRERNHSYDNVSNKRCCQSLYSEVQILKERLECCEENIKLLNEEVYEQKDKNDSLKKKVKLQGQKLDSQFDEIINLNAKINNLVKDQCQMNNIIIKLFDIKNNDAQKEVMIEID